MDFGIKAALMTGLRVIAEVGRETGRSTWVISNALELACDHRKVMIVVSHDRERERFRDALRRVNNPDHTKRVEIGVASCLFELDQLLLSAAPCPFVLDHHVIELIYEHEINRVARDIDALRGRGFPSPAMGSIPTEPMTRALYAFGEREECLGAIPRHNLRPWRG